MEVHFVCNGNTFRSRLAEAYFNSLGLPHQASSSGMEAERDLNGPVTWFAQRMLYRDGLIGFTRRDWQQTTRELLEQADVVVFINQDIPAKAKKLGFNSDEAIVWSVLDVDDLGLMDGDKSLKRDVERMEAAEKLFAQIKRNVDELISELGE